MAHDVFISYSSHDKPTADAACAALEAKGHRCWIAPRDVLPGMDYGEAIVDAIHGARIMVLVYSGSANSSPQIRREVERAVSTGSTIIPFRIEDVPMSKSLEYYISSPHWLDALTPPLERHLEFLTDTVSRLLAAGGPAPVPSPPIPGTVAPARSSRGGLIAVAAVVAVSVLGGLVYMLLPGPSATSSLAVPGPQPSPAPQPNPIPQVAPPPQVSPPPQTAPNPEPAARARVERQFVGRWTSRTLLPGAPPITWTYEVAANGTYRNQGVAEDVGTVQAGGGQWRTVSPNGSNHGTYQFLGPNSVRVTDSLGTTVWTRARTPAGAEGAPLAGEWTADIVRSGATWKGTWSVTPQGGHRFRAVLVDAGTMEATGGRFTIASSSTVTTSGTYSFNGGNSLTMNYPGFSVSWSRL
jgi:hypothetical protein